MNYVVLIFFFPSTACIIFSHLSLLLLVLLLLHLVLRSCKHFISFLISLKPTLDLRSSRSSSAHACNPNVNKSRPSSLSQKHQSHLAVVRVDAVGGRTKLAASDSDAHRHSWEHIWFWSIKAGRENNCHFTTSLGANQFENSLCFNIHKFGFSCVSAHTFVQKWKGLFLHKTKLVKMAVEDSHESLQSVPMNIWRLSKYQKWKMKRVAWHLVTKAFTSAQQHVHHNLAAEHFCLRKERLWNSGNLFYGIINVITCVKYVSNVEIINQNWTIWYNIEPNHGKSETLHHCICWID